jgi:hypothetical protein
LTPCIAAALLAVGCGADIHHSHPPSAQQISQELRFAAEQASIKCRADEVVKLNPQTLRRECGEMTLE